MQNPEAVLPGAFCDLKDHRHCSLLAVSAAGDINTGQPVHQLLNRLFDNRRQLGVKPEQFAAYPQIFFFVAVG